MTTPEPPKTQAGERPDLAGLTFFEGKYHLEERIGSGGMGQVYRGRHRDLERDVAIKVLDPHLLELENAAERFRLEATSASQLRHPNTVQILDFGEDAGHSFIVMELLEGYHLGRYFTRQAHLRAKPIISVMAQILGALAAAHDVGIIHRDIKPENIIITTGIDDRGRRHSIAKVCDFGFAKILRGGGPAGHDEGTEDSGADLTRTGEVLGTPEFVSPEQARGEELDPRSDIYSCGVLLFLMCTGRLPFEGKTDVAMLMMHANAPVPEPRSINPRVPEPLQAIVLKALEKRPEDRYSSAREFRSALLGLLKRSQPPSVLLELPAGLDFTVPDLSVTTSDEASQSHSQASAVTHSKLRSDTSKYASQHTAPPSTAQVAVVSVGIGIAIGFLLGYAVFG